MQVSLSSPNFLTNYSFRTRSVGEEEHSKPSTRSIRKEGHSKPSTRLIRKEEYCKPSTSSIRKEEYCKPSTKQGGETEYILPRGREGHSWEEKKVDNDNGETDGLEENTLAGRRRGRCSTAGRYIGLCI